VVRGDGDVVTTVAEARTRATLEIEFQDGRLALGGPPRRRPKDDTDDGQDRLF
jgi:exodeoxyribonuclease VII large subunit